MSVLAGDLGTFEGLRGPVGIWSLAFSPDGRYLAAAGGDGELGGTTSPGCVKIWDFATRQVVATLRGHSAPIESIALSPDNRRVATGSQDTTVKLWDVEFAQEIIAIHDHPGSVHGLAFSPDGRRLYSASSYGNLGTLMIWDAGPDFPGVPQSTSQKEQASPPGS